jgi:hypothetical protein
MRTLFNRPWRRVTYLCFGLASLLVLFPLYSLAANLLANSGFNNPFSDIPGRVWRGQNEKIASGWQPFYLPDNTYDGDEDASKLHWMSSAQFAATFSGFDYKLEGNQAQNMWSSYEFEAGVYQQIGGLTPGQVIGFDIAIVTFWRGPGYPDSDGKMVKRVGIDPYGGTDPTSGSIIWSDTDANDKAWVYLDVAATAQANSVTVFAKVQAPENDSSNHTDIDMVYFDAAHVDLAPSGTLNASNNDTTVNANWFGSAAPGWSIKGYEVQYRDQASSSWTTLQNKNNQATVGSFTGQPGRTYLIRMRPWQTRPESYNSDIDMPGLWVEQGVTIGNAVIGQVANHLGFGLTGATVSISGTANSTLSGAGGEYALASGGPGTFSIVANDFGGLIAPPPAAISIPANDIGVVNITLRPSGAAQALQNNDFETNLDSWTASSGAAAVSTTDSHSGLGSLWLNDTVDVSQANNITNMDRPVLSFWYKSDTAFTVEFLADAGTVSAKLLPPSSEWVHTTLESGLGDDYSGLAGAKFSHSGGPANIYIDEASIGVGPLKSFLPIVVKN